MVSSRRACIIASHCIFFRWGLEEREGRLKAEVSKKYVEHGR